MLLAAATAPLCVEADLLDAARFVDRGCSGAAAALGPDIGFEASAALAPQTLLRFAVSSSVGDGIPDSTITTVTRRTVPPRVRALIR